jgi:hypothetical protein
LALTWIATVGAFFLAAFFAATTFAVATFAVPIEVFLGEFAVGAPTETVLISTGACELLADTGADWMPKASFEAAVVLLLTAFIELRVF